MNNIVKIIITCYFNQINDCKDVVIYMKYLGISCFVNQIIHYGKLGKLENGCQIKFGSMLIYRYKFLIK